MSSPSLITTLWRLQSIPNQYPVPLIQGIAYYLVNCRVLLTHHQIPVAPEYIPEAQTFQREVNIHSVLWNFDYCFLLDDVLVAFSTESEHFAHMECIFQPSLYHGLVFFTLNF